MEAELKSMNRTAAGGCSDAELKSMKHILRELRSALCAEEVARIERLKARGELTPKEAVHRKSLCRKRYRH